ncbi:integrase family protein [Deinococcus aerius]|uniref:Integrase family protein n=1 Tax=Deinococcus aerius TaxID=200253 RepID=A0A2I9D9I1_9DEIO|nr:tyrosine-type recombinase/integrase [Deinococcus aerius]GBF07250.1 integrase family protein [Deinococcus aerius]
MHLDELWQRHTRHLKLRKRSSYTLTYYGATARALRTYLKGQGHSLRAEAVSVADLRGFMEHLEARGLTEGGIDAHYRALKGVFGWALKDELLDRDPTVRLERIRKPQRLMLTLGGEEYRRMLDAARKSPCRDRETAIVVTLFDTGLRLAEVASLTLNDVRLADGLLRVIGKGNKERVIPLGQMSSEALDRYIRKSRKPRHSFTQNVFLGRAGTPLTRSGVSQILADLAEQAKVPRAHAAPHAFRRAFAVNYLRNGGDVFSLQHVMGHSNLDMTRRYVNLLPEDLARVHAQVSPADRLAASKAGDRR